MKQLLSIALLLILSQKSMAQQPVVYNSFSDFQKNVIKSDENTYVVNFWATWCAPCVKELPYFEKLSQENKKVKVILVSLDSPKDLDKKLIPFLKKKNITAEVVLLGDKDYNSWLPKVDGNWSGSIPATFIFSGSQKLFAEREFDNFPQLNAYVETFINQKK